MRSPFERRVTFVHTGHIGDIIAFLPAYNILGGTDLVITDDPWIQPPMKGFKYDSIKPLIESQGIEVSFNNPARSIDYDMSGWRECYRHELSLMDAQARYCNAVDWSNGHIEITEPWLKVDADANTNDRVIFNRTPRYRNERFPWHHVYMYFNDKALFIGTKEEHKSFCDEIGYIEYYPTKSCLDVAMAIEGSDFFVGNQSSSFWIAAGLNKPLLQETFVHAPNSIVKYKGASYCFDGEIDFDKLGK